MTASVIIAKGKSVRLPNKNIRPFCGLPLVAWSIIQSVCSHRIKGVYLSTDSEKIAEIGNKYGAVIIKRDYKQTPDDSGNVPFYHAAKKLKKAGYDSMFTLLPTSPLRKPGDLDRMVDKAYEYGEQSIDIVSEVSELVLRKITGPHHSRSIHAFKDGGYVAGQSTGTLFTNIDLYLQRITVGSDTKIDADFLNLTVPPTEPFVLAEPWQNYDIDNETEFQFAELVMEHFILKGRGAQVYYDYAKKR